MMIVQCVLLESVRSVFHLPEAPSQTVEAILNVDIDPGIQGELCVNVRGNTAFPLVKGTGRMRVFDLHTALFASTVTDSRGAIA